MCGGGGGGDPFQQIGETLASIDPGPAIGDVGASIDSAVNSAIPGGWITVAALTAGGLALAYAPEVMAFAEANGLTPAAASTELGIAPVNAVTGEAVAPDVFAGLSANAPVDTTLSQAAANSLATGAGTAAATDTVSSLPSLTDPSLTTQIGAPQASTGSFGSISAPLEGSGAIPGAGATTLPGGGLTGALPAGTMVGDGTLGTTIGATYMSAGPGQFAVDALGNAIPATSVGIGGFDPTTGLSLSDLNNARKAAQLANSLLSSSGSTSTATKSGLSSTTSPTASTTGTASDGTSSISGSPKGTFIHGQQIAVPSIAVPEATSQAYTPQALSPLSLELIQQAKTGGIIHKAGGGDLPMQEARMRGKQFTMYQPHSGLSLVPHLAPGGSIPEGHNPTFFSPGGLATIENTYVNGEGDGTSDSVAAMLADGEFVIPADVVSRLGNGSNNAGAKVLDNFLVTIREHAQKHDPKELPPDSKGPLAYLLDAKKKARA
jgi:hypothetical protein